MKRSRTLLFLALTTILVASLAIPAFAAFRNNVQFPNGCQIDEWNGYSQWTNEADGVTHEDFSCELIRVKLRYFDDNSDVWRTADSWWSEGDTNRNVAIKRLTTKTPKYTDHLGKTGGVGWGQKLWY